MEEQKPNIEQILKMMADNLGEEPRPMVLMSKVIPEWIPKHYGTYLPAGVMCYRVR